MSADPDMSGPDDSVILAQLRSDNAAWEREATKHHPERAALYATIALAKWLHDVARRAEVAGLVERVLDECDNITRESRDECWSSAFAAGDRLRSALSRLAQLAGGGA